MHKLKSILGFALAMIKLICLYPIGKLIYSKKKIWLFCERGDDAKDNSFALFKWMNEKKPEIRTVYLISKKSNDLNKVSRVGEICYYKSIKHWLMFVGSSVRLDTHLFFYVPNKYLAVYYMKHHKKSGLDIFLQHGITHNWQDCFYKANNKSDIVICGAKAEYDYLIDSFDLTDNVLKLTGFPRFDTLVNRETTEKFILIMPTWRKWLSNLSIDEFCKSDFFLNYSDLIKNKELNKWAKDNGYKLVFCLHPSFIAYKNAFSSFANECVDVILGEYDIQDLLCRASILITDYSSILFDFAYLCKPTIYYQFDSELFYTRQYKHGYFLIDENGFGPVAKTTTDVFSEIKKNTSINQIYKERINNFFDLHDTENCERVFMEILRKYER